MKGGKVIKYTKGVKRSGQSWWSHLFDTRLKNYQPERPKPSRNTFARRNAILQAAGFLKFERDWLIMGRIDTPNMRRVIEIRRRIYENARVSFNNRNEYVRQIIGFYEDNRWTFKSKGFGKWNPFAMVEHIRDEYDMPNTPQNKTRVKRHKDYMAVKARTPKRKKETNWKYFYD